MPAISPARMKHRYDSILEAASDVFAEKGFEASAMAEIAERARVSEGLIYKYFQNKRDLLARVLSTFNDRIMEDLEREVAARASIREKLETVIMHRLTCSSKYPGLSRLYIAQVRAASDEPGLDVKSLSRRAAKLWSRMLADGVATGEIRPEVNVGLLRDAIAGAIEHLSWVHMTGRSRLDIGRTAKALADTFLNGIAT